MKGTDPAVERLLNKVAAAMREMEVIVGSDFNDLDIHIDDNHNVTALVVSVHHKRNFEYGVSIPISMATKLFPEAIAGYFYGSGAAQYEAERVPRFVGSTETAEVWAQLTYEVRRGDQRIGLILRNANDDFEAYVGDLHMKHAGTYATCWEAAEAIEQKYQKGR